MSQLTKEQLFYANIDKANSDELAGLDIEERDAVVSAMNETSNLDAVSRYQTAHGKLQDTLSGMYLSEEEHLILRSFAASKDEQSSRELSEIDKLAFSFKIKRLIRQTLVYGMITLLGYYIGSAFIPKEEFAFDPLESLVYETIALEENLVGRIDFPTDSIEEVKEWFIKYPNLATKNEKIISPEGWNLKGASVVDYEVTKLRVVAFTKLIDRESEKVEVPEGAETQTMNPDKDILVQYSFDSDSDFFTDFNPSTFGKLNYYTFDTEHLNLIAWQSGDQYNVLVGRMSALEMAELASKAL